MDKKEEELLSIQYRIEKTDVKQQHLEDNLFSISKELKKSKKIRNLFLILFVSILLLMIGGIYYLNKNNLLFSSDGDVQGVYSVEDIHKINDSLKMEIAKLRADVAAYKLELRPGSDVDWQKQDSLNSSEAKRFERRYCYVKKAYRKEDVVFIEVDYLEYYEGRKAVEKAKANGDAEFDIDKKGDTLYFLYNNHYIDNRNSRIRILELDDRARIQMSSINQIPNGFSMKAFKKVIADKLILILEIQNGIVYKITEQKIP